MNTAADAVNMIEKLHNKVQNTLLFMSKMTEKINRYDRISHQEVHIVSKLHYFLEKTLKEVKDKPASGVHLFL